MKKLLAAVVLIISINAGSAQNETLVNAKNEGGNFTTTTTLSLSLSPQSPPTSLPSNPPSTSSPTLSPSFKPSQSPSTSVVPTGSASPSLFPSHEPSLSLRPTSSLPPSFQPTSSFQPSLHPSYSPTTSPSSSNRPSFQPSTTTQPSFPPSLAPTYSPVIAPSSAPSLTDTTSVNRQYIQRLLVSAPQSFDLDQIAIFQFLYQQYTINFGYEIGSNGGIDTESTVLSQQIGINSVARGPLKRKKRNEPLFKNRLLESEGESEEGDGESSSEGTSESRGGIRSGLFHARQLLNRQLGVGLLLELFNIGSSNNANNNDSNNSRKLQETTEEEEEEEQTVQGYPLTMRFTMRYSTRIGVYDISNYNQLFAEYVNANLDKVVTDLTLLGLPVVNAEDVLILKDRDTERPTLAPVPSPTVQPSTSTPTSPPTDIPTSMVPTSFPSDMPSEEPPFIDVDVTDNSFVLGLSLGLAGAFMISAIALLYYRHVEGNRMLMEEEEKRKRSGGGGGMNGGSQPPRGGGYGSNQYSGGYGMHHNGHSADHLDGAASKSTLDLTPNEDAHDDEQQHLDQQQQQYQRSIDAMELQESHDRHHHLSPSVAEQHLSPQAPPAAAFEQYDQYQRQHADVEHGQSNCAPMIHGQQMEQQLLQQQHQQQQQQPVIQPFGEEIMGSIFATPSIEPNQSVSPEASVNYNNLFSLPYDESSNSAASPHLSPQGGERGSKQQQRRATIGGRHWQPKPKATNTQSMMFTTTQQQQIANSMPLSPQHSLMINDASFSSSSDDEDNIHDGEYNPSIFDGSHDELDNYKNQDLETLRTTVENAVDGVEGMMSLAMTRALTNDVDISLEMPWGGATDNGSIEASCLCETYDWLKRHEKSSLDSINEYFQDILNRIVITVMFGMISPLQGGQLVHSCATILGLDLLQELPGKTLIITGMRKTNDLAQGHNFLVKAFKPFGRIEEAAIAPNNHGFGFVRYAKPESVKRAIKKYREFEIEIQDVSVSIKTLKSER